MAHGKLGDLFERCWKDEAFKKRFLSEPAAVLAEAGFDVPEGVEIRVIENGPDEMNIVLPVNPDSLSDAEMDQVAGGTYAVVAKGQQRVLRRPAPLTKDVLVCAVW